MFKLLKRFPDLDLPLNGLSLREVQLRDAEQWCAIAQDPTVRPYLPDFLQNTSLTQARKSCHYLRRFHYDDKGIFWAICNEQDSMIGCCGFESILTAHRRAEIAFDLHSHYKGRGIMSTTIKTIAAHAFSKMHINRIDALTLTHNEPASKTLKRAHFSYEGTLKEYRAFQGKLIDVNHFGLTERQWISCQ